MRRAQHLLEFLYALVTFGQLCVLTLAPLEAEAAWIGADPEGAIQFLPGLEPGAAHHPLRLVVMVLSVAGCTRQWLRLSRPRVQQLR